MATLFQNFQSGTLGADLPANGATMSSSALASVIAVSGGDQLLVTINPFGQDGIPPEVVAITAHTLNATSASITNALYDHPAGTQWFIGPVKEQWDDFQAQLNTQFNQSIFDAAGDMVVGSADNVAAKLAAPTQTGQVLRAILSGSLKMTWDTDPFVCASGALPNGANSYVGMHVFTNDTFHTLVCVAVGSPSTYAYVDTPPGATVAYWGSTPPQGWLWLNGQTVSRTTYAALFAIFGTTYGAGDGSTTFVLPDCREVTFVGSDMGAGAAGRVSGAANPGATGGQAQTVLTSAHIPQHDHGGSTSSAGGHNHGGSMANDGDHVHGTGVLPSISVLLQFNQPLSSEGLVTSGITGNRITGAHMASSGVHNHALTINFVSNHSHTITAYGSSSPTAVTAMQPYMTTGYIIRA